MPDRRTHDDDEPSTAMGHAFAHGREHRAKYAIGGGTAGAIVAGLVALQQLGIIGAPTSGGESSGSNKAQWEAIKELREQVAAHDVRLALLEAR